MNGPHDKKLIQIRPLFFSNNTSTDTKEEIKILLGVSEIKEYMKGSWIYRRWWEEKKRRA